MDEKPRASLVLPCFLAFVASVGIMGVEMASGRMMAMYVGAGLYTWTSVIGVVLGGITIGNLVGGRLADRFDTRRTIALLFLLSALSCAGLPLASYWVGRWLHWDYQSDTSFPLRVAIHVTSVFFLPSACLGLIGPAVAKLALESARSTGRTIGVVYAWGAIGSIFGTFASGFFLIAVLGTSGVVLGVAVLLGATGICLAPRTCWRCLVVAWPLATGLTAASLLVAGRGPGRWIWASGQLAVRDRGEHTSILSMESQYSFIRVTQDLKKKTRNLFMDNLVHAVYLPESPDDLMYDYERVYELLSERHGREREDLRAFFIGGGGYIFPRYIRRRWPKSSVQVAEIDPAVTDITLKAFGLKPEEVWIRESLQSQPPAPAGEGGLGGVAQRPMEIFHLDARNHIEDLLRQKREGAGFEPFDFVFGDAFNDYCVPSHLVTRELFAKIRDLLRPGSGIYLMNVIDIYDSSLFLGSIYNTLKSVFPHVYVLTNTTTEPLTGPNARDTYVVAASLRELDLKDLGKRQGEEAFAGTVLNEAQIKTIETRSKGLVLTDDYCPVENLLDVVVRRRALK